MNLRILLTLASFFILQTSSAAELDVTKYKGQLVYLDFWASWCVPCKESFPWLNNLQKKYPKLKIVGVNLDKEKSAAADFLKAHPAQFEIFYDAEADMAKKYNVAGMPYSVLLNKDGTVHSSEIGFSKEIAAKHMKTLEVLMAGAK
jgi:cytochrome c biogenesis protein CcmG/thiol:disulfide interchange protein DsbE